MELFEPNLEVRIKAAKALAQRILNGQIDTESEFILSLQYVISHARSIGLFDPYFERLTLDDLVLEVELIRAKAVLETQDPNQRASAMINQDASAKDALANQIEEDMMKMPMMPEPSEAPQTTQADLDFMKSGKFIGT